MGQSHSVDTACFRTTRLKVSEIWASNQVTDGSSRQKKEEKKERMYLDRLESAEAIASTMFSIAEKQDSRKSRYATKPRLFRSLLNKLGFVHDGLTFWKGHLKPLEPDDARVRFKTATEKLKKLENSLEGLKSKIHAMDKHFRLGREKWDVPDVSAIWLLIQLEYQSMETPPTDLAGINRMLDELELELPKKEGPSATGLPATIAVYAGREGVIFGECKLRWYPFHVVDLKFKEMRLARLRQGDHHEEVQRKVRELRVYLKPKNKNRPEFQALLHEGELCAYSLCYGEKERDFKRCDPCEKCFHLYGWGGQQNGNHGQNFNPALNCAEDDIHLRVQHGKKCPCGGALNKLARQWLCQARDWMEWRLTPFIRVSK